MHIIVVKTVSSNALIFFRHYSQFCHQCIDAYLELTVSLSGNDPGHVVSLSDPYPVLIQVLLGHYPVLILVFSCPCPVLILSLSCSYPVFTLSLSGSYPVLILSLSVTKNDQISNPPVPYP